MSRRNVLRSDDLRIAIVLPSLLPLAGAERVTLSLIAEFIPRGYAVDLLLTNDPNAGRAQVPNGLRIVEFGAARLRSFILPFARYLRETRPEAVLVSIWPLTSICCAAALLARSPARIIVCDHNTLSMQYASKGPLFRWLLAASLAVTYRLADGRIGVSNGVVDDLAALSGIARDKFRVIHNPMPLPLDPDPDYTRVDAAWKGWRGLRILSVGRLKPQKNHPLLIQAFQRLRRKVDARLMILGSGQDGACEAAIKRLIATEGLQEEVILPGHVYEPGPFYERADLFVLSSDYEGFGNVLIEALAFGCPIVSTDCPHGPAEILEGGRWGRLTPVGDANALEAAMFDALHASHDRDALRRRASYFSPASAADRYLELILPRSLVPSDQQEHDVRAALPPTSSRCRATERKSAERSASDAAHLATPSS